MKYFILSLIFCSEAFYSPSIKQQKEICGEYEFYNDDSLVFQQLKIFENHTYYYADGKHLLFSRSTGSWKLKGDTLLLNSAYPEEGFEIKVKETVSSNKKLKKFVFNGVNVQNLPFPGVVLFRDRSEFIYLNTNSLNVSSANLKGFKVTLSNTVASKTYYIKDSSSGDFEILIPSDPVYNNYLFLSNKKMLVKNKSLYSLNSNNKIDSILFGLKTFKPIKLNKTGAK